MSIAMRNAAILCLASFALLVAATPASAQTEVSFSVNECIYAWTAKYYRDGAAITVRIKLAPDSNVSTSQSTLETRWRNGIVAKWSDKLACTGGTTKLTFDVQWVPSNQHHAVRVRAGSGRSNMGTWYENDDGNTAAHEFGHMLGMKDEYTDPQCPSRSPVNTWKVMHVVTGPIDQRYIDAVCRGVPSAPIEVAANERGQFAVADVNERKTTTEDLGKPTRFHLVVSGGPPGKRLQYSVDINEETKGTSFTYLDETQAPEQVTGRGEVNADFIGQLKAATSRGALRTDEKATAKFLPGTLVGTLTIEAGGTKKIIRYPVDDTNADPWGLPQAEGMKLFADNEGVSSITSLHKLITEQAQRVGAPKPRR
jgi:hypothetical protein